ncbi:MAG: hypothetical protein ACI4UO_05390 [Paludibacteraceae bacterium]
MKIRNLQTILLAMALLFWGEVVCAQVSFNPAYAGGSVHRLTIGADALYYYGDVCPVVDHPMSIPPRKENWGGGLNISYTYQVIPQLGLRTMVSGGYLRGAANDQSYDYWVAKGKTPKAGSLGTTYSLGSFQSGFGELDFGVEWYPIPNSEGGLYIYVGVGGYLGAVYCNFANSFRNPGVKDGNLIPGWRTCIAPVAIGELGYSFRVANGHTLTVKGSLHNALLNVNSKNRKIGYNMDGWGRGALDKADFTYTSSSVKYDKTGESAWGQFTDGYFTIGLAYTFDVGSETVGRVSSARSGRRASFSPRSNTANHRESAYKKKVSKKRNKAFQRNKKGRRISW